MEYDELYDESPYVSKDVPRRGGTGIMNTIRATFLICATILGSVFAIIFYGYQQDQYVVTSAGAFVSIFDRKSKTINICDKGNCNLITPRFEMHYPMAPGMGPQGTPAAQQGQPGQRLLGTFPQPQGQGNPQVAGQPQMTGGNPQMNPQTPGQPPAAGANPQAQQMMQQLMQMQAMAQQMDAQPMTPQKVELIRQRRMLEDQALSNNLLNPQMVQQIRQRRTVEDQQLAQMQQRPNPQMVSGTPQAAAQQTGGAPAAAAPAAEAGEDEAAADDTATDETAAADDTAKADDTATTDDSAATEETEEEAAPV